MTGKSKRLFFICFKLCILMGVFIFMFISFCNPTKIEVALYTFVIFCLSVLNLIYCYVLLDIRLQKSNMKKRVKKKLKDFEKLENTPIYYAKNQRLYSNTLLNYLNNIESSEYGAFIEKGYIFILGTYADLKVFNRQKGISGLFSHSQKYILLYTDTFDRENNKFIPMPILNFKSTFYHEWGHFVDYFNEFISETLEFKRYYYKKKRELDNSVRFLYSGNLYLYLRNNPIKNLYEFKTSSEYFAVNYSKYKMGYLNDSYLYNLFEKLENGVNAYAIENKEV